MQLAIGLVVGLVAVVWSIWITRRQSVAMAARFPRWERAAWASYLLLAALIYVGFAYAAPAPWPGRELLGVLGYGTLAGLGFFVTPKLLALGWLLHAGWDTLLHGAATPFVPEWYRWACLVFDFAAALYIARRP